MSRVRPIDDLLGAVSQNGSAPAEGTEMREPRIRFYTPGQLRDYEPRPDEVLVGDGHIMRGEVSTLGGEPGVGKSRATTALAICGALARNWLGMGIACPFRTMIIQTENGRYRLRQEHLAIPEADREAIEGMVLISEPPPFGLTLNNLDFREDLRAAMEKFAPDLVVLDPWNSVAHDDKQKDYVEAFESIRGMLPTGAKRPALLVVAHTRKPKPDEKRTGGTGMMHLLSGSYVVTSVPRSVLVMCRGSGDEADNSVVLFNPKNNNGNLLKPSAWRRGEATFTPIPDFDWETFQAARAGRRTLTAEDVRSVLSDGPLARQEVVEKLVALAGVSTRGAYNALGGRLAHLIGAAQGGKLCLK